MGCFHSKKEIPDLHPNIYRVVNINDNGSALCSGHLEITETDIILYREGRNVITRWPLHSLRRYGFEGELFSFESGRRCDTGEGIYAFRCRRAALLFRTLQQQIQLRNIVQESVAYPVPGLSPLPHSRQTLQASVVHRSSVDNGLPDNLGQALNLNHPQMSHSGIIQSVNQSRSPSSADILEVMPLYPQSRNNHVANIYQLREFKREHNNNQTETITESQHEYTNDFNRDLAILRNTLKRETAINTLRDMEYETRFLEGQFYKDDNCNKPESNPLSPTLSSSSEHYAQLTMDPQDGSRPYVNFVSHETNLQETSKSEPVPTTPLTPKQVEYSNLASTTSHKIVEINAYANLLLSDKVDSVKSILLNSSEHNHKYSESDTLTSMSPVEELEVNYAVLDIDTNKEVTKANTDVPSPENLSYSSSKTESNTSFTAQARGRLISQNSTEKVPTTCLPAVVPSVNIGYTTIDFDKTVALTSVAAFTDAILDGPRKTRHNSSGILCGSPISVDKSRIN